MDKKRLTPKQELFCQEYLKDLNATQAYIRAGYKARGHSAEVNANKLLSNTEVSARIAELKSVRAEENKISADWVLKRLIEVAERSMQAEEVMTFDYGLKKMVGTGEYTFDSNGANKALELIGKHIGLFDPKHQTIKETALKQLQMLEKQMAKIEAETKQINAKTKLIEGVTKDTGLLEALVEGRKKYEQNND